MSHEANVIPKAPLEALPRTAAPKPAPRPFFWSVRRELWENRSIYIAPFITACVVLLGFVFMAVGSPQHRRAALLLDPAQQRIQIEMPYDIAFSMILLTVFVVWLFYCLDALYGERRDRSILFWKSLPVSDLTSVLSKASIPLVVLPLVTFVITVVTQLIMVLASTIVLMMHGLPPATSSQLPLLQFWRTLPYGLVAMTLWDAPIYGWLFLVSAWARRATLLWAVLPMVAIAALERIAFQTTYVASFLKYRGTGWMTEAFAFKPRGNLLIDPMNPIAPVKFLTSPDLWIGLAFAAAFLVAAARLRRYRASL